MKRLLHVTTWLAIWLVLTMPIAAAQQVLTVQKFAGRDNVPNFAKENDELTIQVLAQMLGSPTPDVARQLVRVYNADTYTFFDTCTAQANNYQQCNYKTTDLIYGGTDAYSIKLFDAENNELATVDKTLTVDFLAPKIMSFSISPDKSSTPVPTTITYKAEDYGTQTGQVTNCAGIKTINFTANNKQVGIASAQVAECSKEGTFTFTPQITGTSARVTVCAVATDHLNHKSLPACKDLLIDSQKPTAQAIELRDPDGFLITHARSTQPISADVYVKIPDVDVDPSTVYADLSKLNPGLGKVPRDDEAGEWFIWQNVLVTTPNTCQVTVEATDYMGNKDTKTLTCTIGVDDTGPAPGTISTQFVDEDNKPILGVSGTIFATFTEASSGMDKSNAYLDLRQLGAGSEIKANKCEKTTADQWKCSWNVRPTVSSGTYTVKALPTTRDDLDNQLTGTLQQEIRYDNTAPANVRVKEIAAFRGQQRVKTNITSLGETIEFVVEGAGFATVAGDLSDLGGPSDMPAESCTGNLTKTCTFGYTVSVSGPQETNITFNFSDAAGNTALVSTTELFILGIGNETAPNYWNITTHCSPTLLDRATLSVFEHPVYCRLALTSTNPNARPISVLMPDDFSECTGQTDYISDLNIENDYAGSTEPFMVLSLVATDYAINQLTFACPVKTLTRVGNFMPQNFETDNATVTLQFYNLPLGELYDNIDDEIEDVEDKIGGVWKIIGQLQKFMGYAEKLCQILNMITTILSTVTSILILLGATELALKVIPGFGTAAAEEVNQIERSACKPTENLREIYNNELLGTFKKFCDFLTCQSGLFDVLGSAGLDIVDVDLGSATWFYDMLDPAGLGGALGTDTQSMVAGSGDTIQNPNTYLNVKDSLIYSILIPPLCIPGIIYNLDKWRQIECRYGTCLLEDVKRGGLPVSVCKDQKAYMQCRFVVGEIFNIIPFAPIVNYYLNLFQQAISDPLVLAGIGIAFLLDCKTACNAPKTAGFAYYACAGLSILSQLGQSVNMVKNMKSVTDFGSIDNNWCEQFEEAQEDYGG